MRLIVAGLSNPEIAEELFIAVSAVKAHVNHIHGKLAVGNRVDAVTQAQALGLVRCRSASTQAINRRSAVSPFRLSMPS